MMRQVKRRLILLITFIGIFIFSGTLFAAEEKASSANYILDSVRIRTSTKTKPDILGSSVGIGRYREAEPAIEPTAEPLAEPAPQTLSIYVFPKVWDIGEIEPGATVTMDESEKITVVNDGDGRENLTLSLETPKGWAAASKAGTDSFVLNAAFSDNLNNIEWDEARHSVTTESAISTDIKFAGGQNGISVSPNEERYLYLQFKSPTRTQTTGTESIRVIVSCEIPND